MCTSKGMARSRSIFGHRGGRHRRYMEVTSISLSTLCWRCSSRFDILARFFGPRGYLKKDYSSYKICFNLFATRMRSTFDPPSLKYLHFFRLIPSFSAAISIRVEGHATNNHRSSCIFNLNLNGILFVIADAVVLSAAK